MAELDGIELGPKMLACSERERLFVLEFLRNGCENATDAARKAGFSDPGLHSSSIRVRAHGLRHRAKVIAAMQEVGRQHFGGLLLPAVLAAEDMIANAKHPDHAKMVAAVLSAHGLGEKTHVQVSGEVVVNHTDQALEQLRIFRDLGVPRAKLEELFGFSGLSRYERMLAEQDGKRPMKVIEHDRRE